MKRIAFELPPFVVFLLLLLSCNNGRVIDEIYPWPVSGVSEADSLLLEIERLTLDNGSLKGRRLKRKLIIEEFCSIASLHPDNAALQSRKIFVEAIEIPQDSLSRYKAKINEGLERTDSSKFPFEYHKLLMLELESEYNLVRKYNIALDNISFFSDRKSPVDLGRNLILAGNVMDDLQDTVKALQYVEQAEKIFRDLNISHGVRIAQNNRAIKSPESERIKIYMNMIEDSSLVNDPFSAVLIYQNLGISKDSLPLLEKALELYRCHEMDSKNVALVCSLIGHYLTIRGEPEKGLQYILDGVDSTRKYAPDNMGHYLTHYNFLADAYYELGMKDSCIEAFSQARIYNRLYQEQKMQASVYASDAASRIEMAKRNLRLEKERTVSGLIIVILLMCIGLIGMVFIMRKRRAEKQHEEELMKERNERNLQSIRAQSKVMEENDRLLDSLDEKIEELKSRAKISDESADSISRILKIHRSNEENRQGFLKVQQELDTRFIENLRHDFPDLSESQMKLASLIAAGLDSRQICNILNIEQASVHKSRYRLRSRLGLKKEQSLEEFLKGYNRPAL